MPRSKRSKHPPKLPKITPEEYSRALNALQIQLVKLQRHAIREGLKLVVVFEGRDGAGKDGMIKRLIEHLSPRETRVVALGKPSDRERSSWYFQRYVSHLPSAGEIVLFNRSWYNRAGVERVMGFCSPAEYEAFIEDAPRFEELIERSAIVLRKYYLDISREEQERRLAARERDPLKQWKVSPVDKVAVKRWEAYSEARNEMFARTHTVSAPWRVVRADNKHAARLSVIRDLLTGLDFKGKDERLLLPDPNVVFGYSDEYRRSGMIAP